MDKKINFLHTCREAAAEAEKLFGMNARIILAQGALESGWGTSMLATEHHNFFGLMGYGASNAYWHGQRATLETAYGTHHFRHYEATPLFPGVRPPDPLRLSPRLPFQLPARSLRQGDRLQPLHQRTKR